MPYDSTAPMGYGGGGAPMRDRITQALMRVQNPPPVTQMPPQPNVGASPMGAPPPMTGGAPGGAPGMPTMPQLRSAVPGGAMPSPMMGQQSPMMGQQQPMPQPSTMASQY